jgi:hypothetical protein
MQLLGDATEIFFDVVPIRKDVVGASGPQLSSVHIARSLQLNPRSLKKL